MVKTLKSDIAIFEPLTVRSQRPGSLSCSFIMHKPEVLVNLPIFWRSYLFDLGIGSFTTFFTYNWHAHAQLHLSTLAEKYRQTQIPNPFWAWKYPCIIVYMDKSVYNPIPYPSSFLCCQDWRNILLSYYQLLFYHKSLVCLCVTVRPYHHFFLTMV